MTEPILTRVYILLAKERDTNPEVHRYIGCFTSKEEAEEHMKFPKLLEYIIKEELLVESRVKICTGKD